MTVWDEVALLSDASREEYRELRARTYAEDEAAQLFVSAHPEGAGPAEIARFLGVTREAVRQVLARAMVKVREADDGTLAAHYTHIVARPPSTWEAILNHADCDEDGEIRGGFQLIRRESGDRVRVRCVHCGTIVVTSGGSWRANSSGCLPCAAKRRRLTIEAEGRALSVEEWAAVKGIRVATIRSRLRDGWEPAAAVTTPSRRYRRTA